MRPGVLPLLVLALAACGRGPDPATPATRCPDRDRVSIGDEADVATLAGCARLPTLTVRSAAPIDLSRLTSLTYIEGDLSIGPTLGLTSITLPALENVSGTIRISANGDLQSLLLPALRMTRALELVGNPSLASVSAPALERVHGLLLEQLPALELVDTSRLGDVGDGPRVHAVPSLATWVGPPPRASGAVIDAPRLDPEARDAIGREGPARL